MKILVCDDNPHVLALMQRTLEPHGEVEAYHDCADVFLRATMSAPDLIVADFRMKGMDGRELVQGLRARPETKQIPVIIIATKLDIEEELQSIAGQVEEFIVKPFYARDLGVRAKRTLDKTFLNKKQNETGGAFRGKLSEMNIMDLFQAMEMGAKTCLLSVADPSGEKSARIYFGEGQVYHCDMDGTGGDDVVNQVVKWQEGTFEINFNAPRAADSNTTTGTQGLLMEAMRLMDEENR